MANSGNHLLDSLSGPDFARLEPHLRRVPLRLTQILEKAGEPLQSVCFPTAGVVSVVFGPPGFQIEVGVIGREGMTGHWSLISVEATPYDSFVQIEGEGLVISQDAFNQALLERPSIHLSCLKGVAGLMSQMARNSLANGKCPIHQRAAGWILLCHDRVECDQFRMTHEFLALMLGVRRASVSTALAELEGEGAIRNTRSTITIRNRDLLEQLAGESYARI